jgi:hypothetical protein
MRYFIIGIALVVSVVLWQRTALAEVKTVSEVSEAATGEFAFKKVPSPSRVDVGNTAKFSIIAGRRDGNGANVAALTDGRLPGEPDEPAVNFFFAAGTEGGRLVADLTTPVEITSVNTYSWHPTTRGPQVYKLYGSDGSSEGFDARPGRDADLEKAGWKLIAAVDTRPKEGSAGGQHGVSIADTSGAAFGKYRYLLFDISATDKGDSFGNTFFSEIDIHDGKEHAPPAPPPAPELDVVSIDGKYEIAFDLSQMPELKEWVDTKLKPVCVKWYPMIVEMLPSDGYTAPQRFTIVFHKDMRGVANAGGRRINCAGPWFERNLEGEAVGAVVHEMVHIVQQYGGRRSGGNRNPGWMVEGLADYIRWFLYEPEDKRPRPNPARAKYTDSYRITGAFLNYLVENHDKEIVKKLNAAMRAGKYAPELWKEYTGKTVDELWAEYIKTLEK